MNDTGNNTFEMIAIVVPMYNAAQYLDECVQSVLHQDSVDWELVLVDDGSTDATSEMVKKYLGDARVRYYRKENSGVQNTRWYGIERATAEYITFLDADDLLLPETISTLHRYMGLCDILSFGMQTFCEIHEIDAKQPLLPISERNDDRIAILKSILSGRMLSCVCGGLYKREMLLACRSQFCNGLKIGEDTMFNLEFAYSMSPCVGVLPMRLYCYRTNHQSVSHTYDDKRHEAVNDTIRHLEDFLSHHHLARALRAEAGFRFLLLWSSFMFHPDNPYYRDRALRRKMRKAYFPAFRYLYPYLRVYLFIDLFMFKLEKKWK